MSFSADVKNELARLPVEKQCCQKAELLGLLKMSGAMVLSGSGMGVHFSTENAALARRVLQLLKTNYAVQTEVVITRSRRLKKNNRYQVRVLPSPVVTAALRELQMLPDEVARGSLLAQTCCRRAFLRGVFLGGGSLSRPASDYHLEIVTENKQLAQAIVKVMHAFSLSARLTDRKDDYIVYLKEGNAIIDFLRVVGAAQALLEFENVRIVKEMRNGVNRVVNCETANLNKVIRVAVPQVESIQFLKQQIGYAKLPQYLRDTAELRLAHPEAPLSELVELCHGEVGRSGMNHRLKKLVQLAKDWGLEMKEASGVTSAQAGGAPGGEGRMK